MLKFRLYLIKRSRTVRFLTTVQVPTLADAVNACAAYRARLQPGDRFAVRVVR